MAPPPIRAIAVEPPFDFNRDGVSDRVVHAVEPLPTTTPSPDGSHIDGVTSIPLLTPSPTTMPAGDPRGQIPRAAQPWQPPRSCIPAPIHHGEFQGQPVISRVRLWEFRVADTPWRFGAGTRLARFAEGDRVMRSDMPKARPTRIERFVLPVTEFGEVRWPVALAQLASGTCVFVDPGTLVWSIGGQRLDERVVDTLAACTSPIMTDCLAEDTTATKAESALAAQYRAWQTAPPTACPNTPAQCAPRLAGALARHPLFRRAKLPPSMLTSIAQSAAAWLWANK